ncbi:MAG: bacillithiol biosynthesis deacetylase BshB1 [Candidatus Hydrogenedentes bacterium]|nr:bacillithiol biosynthesis deacetylase BshB1 [Candidatus Hydrogenedentota bacterium]
MTVDVLAIGAHPDDVEIGIGGLIHKLAKQGVRVAILDMTAGELASRGTLEERGKESTLAAERLGVTQRENAGLPDGKLSDAADQRVRIIPFIRSFRPRLLLAPAANDRHPDHEAAHHLVRAANFLSGLTRIETGRDPYRVPVIYYYQVHGHGEVPPFVVDISEHYEAKLHALRAYESQLHNPDYEGPKTYVSSPEFWEFIQTRAAFWGNRIGVKYGEPLYADLPVRVDLPLGLEDLR